MQQKPWKLRGLSLLTNPFIGKKHSTFKVKVFVRQNACLVLEISRLELKSLLKKDRGRVRKLNSTQTWPFLGFCKYSYYKKKCIPEKLYLCRNESFVLTNLARPCFQKFICCLITRLNGKQIKEQINKPFQKNIGLEKKGGAY